ncbi:5'-methylthioadenosine phosphorylase [Ignicoccus pacificus DSM 13166]|uniref:5'-methylthioadenosine phosphorylase n=1 Tax=Ignicoccus pacificus DSM 13166 TaxID=940294 RepID=A0A977KAY1_9CREN|nr:5'-methylthioadenosine phosphorylase [Ignicoccus pacificus DSM 13166]
MKPQHLTAKPGEVAERVVVVGDPARAKMVAQMLEDSKLVSSNRELLVFTGKYKGVPVSVAVHGIGGPSAAIVFEELRMLGAKAMVRLGTAGSMKKEIDVGHGLVVTGAAYYCGGVLGVYSPNTCLPTSPDPWITTKLYEKAKEVGLPIHYGPVVSNDAFYAESPDFVEFWTKRGIVAVEMECATLFALGWMRGFRTGALVVMADSLVDPKKKDLLHHEQLAPAMEKATKAVLEALVDVEL